jgi:hypothetical protein
MAHSHAPARGYVVGCHSVVPFYGCSSAALLSEYSTELALAAWRSANDVNEQVTRLRAGWVCCAYCARTQQLVASGSCVGCGAPFPRAVFVDTGWR